MHILLIEDDEIVAEQISEMVHNQAWEITTANSLADGEDLLSVDTFDLAIIDWMLPDGEGTEIVSWLRSQNNEMPVLLLTAKSQTDDIVAGLEIGADDYLTKPFAMAVLIARVQALLRRKSNTRSPIIKIADLVIDTNLNQVTRAGQLIKLAPREYSLLEYLAFHRDQVIDRLTLLHHVWGDDVDEFSNTMDVHIRYLRKKIDEPFDFPLIHTIKQKGYLLCAEFQKFTA